MQRPQWAELVWQKEIVLLIAPVTIGSLVGNKAHEKCAFIESELQNAVRQLEDICNWRQLDLEEEWSVKQRGKKRPQKSILHFH